MLSGHQLSRVDQLGTLSLTHLHLMLCPSLYIKNHNFTVIPMIQAQHCRVCTRLPCPTFVTPFSDCGAWLPSSSTRAPHSSLFT